jgi:hypothetical protein
VRTAWEQAQLCLAACGSLGSAEPAILSISQFWGTQTQWLRLDELASRHCHLYPVEYTALTSWLSLLETQQFERSAAASRPSVVTEGGSEFFDILPQRCHSAAGNAEMLADLSGLEQTLQSATSVEIKRHERLRCPPCIRGQISGVQPHEQLVLRCIPQDGLPGVEISAITDQQLVEYLCQHRAVFPCPRSDEDFLPVECLFPFCAVVHPYLYSQEYVVVCREVGIQAYTMSIRGSHDPDRWRANTTQFGLPATRMEALVRNLTLQALTKLTNLYSTRYAALHSLQHAQ